MENKNAKIIKGKPITADSAEPGRQPQPDFPIVGIGSSAGGLEALQKFFTAMPHDSGMAFVVVSHMDPNQVSNLPDILRRHTKMDVFSIQDNTKVQPNTVYVIPPNYELYIEAGILHLKEPEQTHGHRLPVDDFFKSLAGDIGKNSIGIIFSGTGSDGTIGMLAIKNERGVTLAQDPESASYDGMPKSAIDSGVVDKILTPEQMPEYLSKIVNLHLIEKSADPAIYTDDFIKSLPRIFSLIKRKTKRDFSMYKKKTLCRRIEKRMARLQINDIYKYVRYLQENDKEIDMLVKELLIKVTNFFRDKEAFVSLKKYLLVKLNEKPADYQFRVWIPGCSTGEEAYSLAIIFSECASELGKKIEFQLFCTDADEDAINIARKGIYHESISEDVDNDRLTRFFQKEGTAYQIKKSVREKMIFAVQDLISDPPFTKLDLISCRNLLIYLDSGLQAKILSIFNFSLKDDGLLFIGASESIGLNSGIFSIIDKKWKIYKHKDSGSGNRISVFPVSQFDSIASRKRDTGDAWSTVSMRQALQNYIAREYSPPCVIINEKKEVVFTQGDISKYVTIPSGRLNPNIFDMIHPNLRLQLDSAIKTSESANKQAVINNVHLPNISGAILVNLKVAPFKIANSEEIFTIITFEESNQDNGNKEIKSAVRVNQKIGQEQKLEEEVQILKETLQSTVEKLRTTNEEQLSSNEELQSMNEELQSANEELETTKEEQQSMNEELITTNAELESRFVDMRHLNDDMKNLLNSTQIATLFLDNHQKIKGFTPSITQIMNLIMTDVGRPLKDISSNLEYDNLLKDAEQVLSTLVEKKIRVRSSDGVHYLVRILPYRTSENVIDGVVITFMDITEQKNAEELVKKVHNYAEEILAAIAYPILLLNGDLHILAANKSFQDTFKMSEKETVGKFFGELGEDHLPISALLGPLKDVASGKTSIDDYQVNLKIGNKQIFLHLTARKMNSIQGIKAGKGQGNGSDKNQILLTFRLPPETKTT